MWLIHLDNTYSVVQLQWTTHLENYTKTGKRSHLYFWLILGMLQHSPPQLVNNPPSLSLSVKELSRILMMNNSLIEKSCSPLGLQCCLQVSVSVCLSHSLSIYAYLHLYESCIWIANEFAFYLTRNETLRCVRQDLWCNPVDVSETASGWILAIWGCYFHYYQQHKILDVLLWVTFTDVQKERVI